MGNALFRIEELRAIERAAAAALPPGTLMARAGRAAAEWIAQRRAGAIQSVCVLCGPGNNGGDGFVVAAELRERGHDVRCVLLGTDRPSAPDARAAFERWTASGGHVDAALPAAGAGFDIVVDALFGIGMARPLAGEFLAAVHWMKHQPFVVAIDVPSGLDADTGAWVGGVAGARADATVTFIGDKPGLHTAQGLDAAGTVVVEPIDAHAEESVGHLIGVDDFEPVVRPRRRDTHKGTYGNVAVVGGGRGMVGAVLLAGRAALRLGAGRVYVDAIGAPELRVDPVRPELMFRPYAELDDLQAIVVGCGLGADPAARAALAAVLAGNVPVVADADALNLLAADADLQRRASECSAALVLTPHPLEAARLLLCSAADVQHDRVAATIRLAQRYRCIVVLKGAGTVVARSDGCYAINPTGSPALSTAGTGDVLAGMIAAFIAQGHDLWTSTQAAAWLHGAAARDIDIGLLADEVAARAVDVLRTLRDQFSA
jgi:ADP-dependent NAD(P)H-hydrate dehydratase / NAD(P)H-hydrate epimerase